MADTDQFVFAEPTEAEDKAASREAWRVLIVDDEDEVHKVTTLVLKGFSFDNRKLEFLHAYSAQEAEALLKSEADIALILLDVVMETDQAGLDLAKRMRVDLNNHMTRIVLRTGQPGQAPEERVIADYDINDYKDKTELTTTKLKTLFYSTLRSYRDIRTLDANRKGLEKVITASSQIYELKAVHQFSSAVLEQITLLLDLQQDAIFLNSLNALAASYQGEHYNVLAATGSMKDVVDGCTNNDLPEEVRERFSEALRNKHSVHGDKYFIGYFVTNRGSENLLYVSYSGELSDLDQHLLGIFSTNVAIAYENMQLKEEIEATQRELVYILGEAVEKRSKETGGHVKRVAKISEALSIKYGLGVKQAELMKLASPLHDIGKIGIPDSILNKPGKHTSEEWAVMQTHARIGYDMLGSSDKRILRLGAVIAHEHHERWDGKGYPRGLTGEEIDIAGRITAVADVFDALGSERCYKKAWPMEDIKALFEREKGLAFEPKLVDLLFENIEEIQSFRELYPD